MICLLLVATFLYAQDSAGGKALNDPLLDKLIGDWNVERKFGNGRTAKNVVHGEWVLQHQFVELHYRDAALSPNYEAIVVIGYDDIANHYICHWADKFGALTRLTDSRPATKHRMRLSSSLSSTTAR